ncbi:hypothetical protein DXA59_04445 [Clostridium sp. OF03-18AA]|nr:hypothetical protein DXA59_04445 [Clostridium sp. OF03-18AA]HCW26335.1 hypothetical protein [Lachnoclostridium sp.]HCY60944.1 hypothetical protein [Lachnoclostridium sp.]
MVADFADLECEASAKSCYSARALEDPCTVTEGSRRDGISRIRERGNCEISSFHFFMCAL